MATKPTPGGSDGTYGDELNAFLDVSLDTNGFVKNEALQTTSAAPIADAALANKKYVDDKPGLAGGWVVFLGRSTNGACTVLSNFNVTSVTRTATGRFTITWDTAFSGTDYPLVGGADGTAGGNATAIIPLSQVAAQALISVVDTTDGTGQDLDGRQIHVVCFGQ